MKQHLILPQVSVMVVKQFGKTEKKKKITVVRSSCGTQKLEEICPTVFGTSRGTMRSLMG